MKFLLNRLWSIAYDPNFVAAKKNKRTGNTAIQKIDDALGDLQVPLSAAGSFENFAEHALAISAGELYRQDQLADLAIISGPLPDQDLQVLAINAGSRDVQFGSLLSLPRHSNREL